jgi:renalase
MGVKTEYVGPVGPWSIGHPVDIGAPYFTVREPAFAQIVAGWELAGLARPWTDTFAVAGSGGLSATSAGPRRWSTTGGMRTLVESLAEGLDVELAHPVTSVLFVDGQVLVDGEPVTAVVLAMPDRQAVRHVSPVMADALDVTGRESSPVLAVWAAWPERWWPAIDGVFVNESAVISWIADSGRSRGDGAPVLVVHSTGDFAAPRLKDPQSGLEPMLAELRRLLGATEIPPPEWARLHRWSFASPVVTHDEPFRLLDGPGDPVVGVCGDAWGPKSRIEQAWLSGYGLAGALLNRLAVTLSTGPHS